MNETAAPDNSETVTSASEAPILTRADESPAVTPDGVEEAHGAGPFANPSPPEGVPATSPDANPEQNY